MGAGWKGWHELTLQCLLANTALAIADHLHILYSIRGLLILRDHVEKSLVESGCAVLPARQTGIRDAERLSYAPDT